MIESVTTTSTSAAAAAMKQSMGMNKDDFLKLFITQLQNQDPLNPMDGTEQISQLAQLTQVEQSYNTNSNLLNIVNALGASSALSAISFVGSEVTAAGSQLSLTEGEMANVTFSVPKSAEQVSVNILNAKGEVVHTLNGGVTAAGESALAWDGKDANGMQLPSGIYSVAVTGVDAAGNTFAGSPFVRGTVEGINFSGSSPLMNIAGLEIPFSDLLRVKGVM
ncbi:MAG: flagellar hook assembly protein FlgD [Deltaproteobacteria bacterium]|nr:flagellar hook assembly protein FlgD [Deltaproteobacteria bacterium]TLN04831.1 MAG: flagellar hook assembly protein FlgD [bacterium]